MYCKRLVVSVTAVAVALSSSAVLVHSCVIQNPTTISFYGLPDNSPPSARVAYNCGGRNNIAGGTGTYADPVTFASAPGEFNACETVYLPYLEKYVRMEDTCEQCITDWKSGIRHVDVWTGSNTVNGGQAQINCEAALTPSPRGLIRYPATNYKVDATALFADGLCSTRDTYPNNKASSFCA